MPLGPTGYPRYVYRGTSGIGAPRRVMSESVGSKGGRETDLTTPYFCEFIFIPLGDSQLWQWVTVASAVDGEESRGDRTISSTKKRAGGGVVSSTLGSVKW